MNKRRRLLITNTTPYKEGTYTQCRTCGLTADPEDGYYFYHRASHIGYCNFCKSTTLQYHCSTAFDDGSEACNTKWCSVCSRPTECPKCLNTNNTTFAIKSYYHSCNIHQYRYYECTCGNCIPFEYSIEKDHDDGCEEEEDTPVVYCPVCHKQATWIGEGYCKQCGKTDWYRCDAGISEGCVGYEFCSRGHDTALLDCWFDNGDQCTYSWDPTIFETSDYPCPTCENDSPTVYECPTCGMLRCFKCHTVVRGTIY